MIGVRHGHRDGLFHALGWRPQHLVHAVWPEEPRGDYAFEVASEEAFFAAEPEIVFAMGTTRAHLAAVQACHARGIPVVVEKPLTVWEEDLAWFREHQPEVYVNYETTWYPAWAVFVKLLPQIEPIRRLEFTTGHMGPREIGCDEDFVAWLTDPEQNGEGALADFGCYGIATSLWLLGDPVTVSVCAERRKYEVVDYAEVTLTYPGAEAVVVGSWDLDRHEKSFRCFGAEGTLEMPNGDQLLFNGEPVEVPKGTPGFERLLDFVSGEPVPSYIKQLGSLELNLRASEILVRTQAQI